MRDASRRIQADHLVGWSGALPSAQFDELVLWDQNPPPLGASVRTQSDSMEVWDHSTTTHRASFNAASITPIESPSCPDRAVPPNGPPLLLQRIHQRLHPGPIDTRVADEDVVHVCASNCRGTSLIG